MLVAQRHQPLDLDAIALTPGRALHPYQVVERNNGDGEIVVDDESVRIDQERLIRIALGRRFAETVERAEFRSEQEVLAVEYGALVHRSRDACGHVAPVRVQLAESCGEPSDVLAFAVVDDVEIASERRRSMNVAGDATDDHETYLVSRERPQELTEIE